MTGVRFVIKMQESGFLKHDLVLFFFLVREFFVCVESDCKFLSDRFFYDRNRIVFVFVFVW